MTVLQRGFALRDGHEIPAVGFGTYLIDGRDVSRAVEAAIASGYRHVDTAASYENEAGVGNGIRLACARLGIERGEIFITTKFAPGWVGEPPKDKSRTLQEAQQSLDRLGMDYVDLYLIHAPFGGSARLDQWRALLELQEAGKARSIGVSNYAIRHLEEIRRAGLPLPSANQLELHPWSQKPDLIDYMRDHGILPIAYSSLLPLSTWRHEAGQDSAKVVQDDMDANAFSGLAARYAVTEAQFLLRWAIQCGFAVLPKSLDPGRMRENIALCGFAINEADMRAVAAMDRGAGVAWASGDPLELAD